MGAMRNEGHILSLLRQQSAVIAADTACSHDQDFI